MDFDTAIRYTDIVDRINAIVYAVHDFVNAIEWIHVNPFLTSLTVFLVIFVLYVAKRLIFSFGRGRKPTTCRCAAVIKNLRIHFISGLGPCDVSRLKCTPEGFSYGAYFEKMWFFIDRSQKCVSIANDPMVASITFWLHEADVFIDGPGMPTLKLEMIHEYDNESEDLAIRLSCEPKDLVGRDCGDKVAQWFARYLKRPHIRLVQRTSSFQVQEPDMTTKKLSLQFGSKKQLYFGDFPIIRNRCITCISHSTIEDFSQAMSGISHNDYDYDVMVKGSVRFEEFYWQCVFVGRVDVSKPHKKEVYEGDVMLLISERVVLSYHQLDKLQDTPLIATPIVRTWHGRNLPNLTSTFWIDTDGYLELGDLIKVPI